VRTRSDTLNGIIITGDIATTGRQFDLDRALEVVEKEIAPICLDLGVLPGNHDRWIPHRKGRNSALLSLGYDPGGKDFHATFRDFWGPGDVRTFRFFDDKFCVAVVAADLSLRESSHAGIPRIINKHGQGKAYEDVLTELENATLTAANDSEFKTVVVWAIHFPPYNPDIADDLRLIEEKELIDKAEWLGVSTILTGHSHIPRAYGIPTYQARVFCAGSVCEYNQSKNNFFIVTVEDLGNDYRVGLKNYEFDDFQRRFVKRPFTFG
jgi:3',5'-cyclic AMP phosphodiesterase CpdA